MGLFVGPFFMVLLIEQNDAYHITSNVLDVLWHR